eukprot:CAMPEP_0196808212 /NCGR_PEP_ID=MMETSP1362-20130617/8203_1 /TAXON_ID=163516 /ORGANISM="Leptocylindrus danicus, Strain CCMP1856" /LENGTH=142 /DNA_ID=CAMNT_0042182461 /DNA_START=42 /DNA_END=470 /DNA_ORIENTATION=-
MMKQFLYCLLLAPFASAFAPSGAFIQKQQISSLTIDGPASYGSNSVVVGAPRTCAASQRQTQLHGLFGLGGPEIAIILVAAAFLLGPEKLAELGKDAGKMAGELKEVPKEFQAGIEEGEKNAKAMKAKTATPVEEPEESSSA